VSFDSAPSTAPAYTPLEPIQRLITGLCAFIAACAVTFLIGSFLFVAHMQAGGYPFTFSRGWIGVMTAAGDLCLIMGIGGLFLLLQFLKRGRRNIQALHLSGAISEPDVQSTILLHPGHFALSYERVVMDLWQLCAPRHITRNSQGRVSTWLPYLWWTLLLLTPLLYGIMGSLEGRYYGTGTRIGQLFVGQIYLAPYGITLLLCGLTWYLTSTITHGQASLAALPRSTTPPPLSQLTAPKPKRGWYIYPALVLVLGSSYFTHLFLEHVAPKIFVTNTEMTARQSVLDEARNALLVGDFTKLETLYENFPPERRSASGVPLLDYLYRGTRTALQDNPASAQRTIAAWQKAQPTSTFAALVGIQARIYDGKQYFAARDDVMKALSALDKETRNDPHYWSLYILALAMNGTARETLETAFLKSALQFPDYYPLYFQFFDILRPPATAALALLDQARRQISGDERNMVYARMVWYLWETGYQRETLIKTASWPDISAGFKALLKIYPALQNLNAYAYFACQAGDLATTKELMKKIEGQALYRIWGDEFGYGRCNIWALSTPLP
jgi:hypothetical protein